MLVVLGTPVAADTVHLEQLAVVANVVVVEVEAVPRGMVHQDTNTPEAEIGVVGDEEAEEHKPRTGVDVGPRHQMEEWNELEVLVLVGIQGTFEEPKVTRVEAVGNMGEVHEGGNTLAGVEVALAGGSQAVVVVVEMVRSLLTMTVLERYQKARLTCW